MWYDLVLKTYGALLPIILGYIAYLLKKQTKERSANSLGTMLLLRVQIIEYHEKYMERGSIPTYAYENFMEIYKAYHDLGGNGMAEKMKKDVEQLKIEIKKKERN